MNPVSELGLKAARSSRGFGHPCSQGASAPRGAGARGAPQALGLGAGAVVLCGQEGASCARGAALGARLAPAELLPVKVLLNHYYLSGHKMRNLSGNLEQKQRVSLNGRP